MKVARFYILVTLLFSFFMVVAHEEPPKTKKEKTDAQAKQEKMIRNGISRVTVWRYNVENGIVSDVKQKYAELNYNGKGLNSSILVYRNDSLKYKTVNVFDFDGNRILDFDYKDGKAAGNAVFEYKTDGLIEKIFNLDSTGQVISEDVYSYNSDKKQIVFSSYLLPEKIDYTYTYIYDTQIETGNCIEIVHRDSAGKQVMRVVNVFDKNNVRQEKIIYNADDKQDYKFTYTYTESGDYNVIKIINADGKVLEADTYTYNEYGMLISIESKDGNGIMTDKLTYAYTFDFTPEKTETPDKN